MMELLEESSSNEMIFNALDRLPVFSNDIQSNNVLSRRIEALRNKSGKIDDTTMR